MSHFQMANCGNCPPPRFRSSRNILARAFLSTIKDISGNLLHLKNLHSGEVCQQLIIVRPSNEAKVLQLEEQIAKARVQLQAPWQGQGEQEKPQLLLDLDF